MTTIERQHASLRKAFDIIDRETPATTAERTREDLAQKRFDSVLQSACKAVNDAIGPDGLVPTLLVYGTMPRLGGMQGEMSKTNKERAQALRKATHELTLINARRQIRTAVNTRNNPNPANVRQLPLGSLAIVYRSRLKA